MALPNPSEGPTSLSSAVVQAVYKDANIFKKRFLAPSVQVGTSHYDTAAITLASPTVLDRAVTEFSAT